MATGFEIAGRLAVAVEGFGDREARALTRAFDPCPAGDASPSPDVVMSRGAGFDAPLVDLQRDAGDGRLTATDGERFYSIARGARCALPPPGGPPPARFELEAGFPLGGAVRRLVRPVLQTALHARGAVAVHSAAVVVDGRAVLVAGWSESGKTETALALAERGAVFLSDKWTIVGDDGTAAVFPIGVGVRGWVLAHLPRLRAALAWTPRARLAIAGAGRAAARRLPAEGGDAL